MNIILKIDTPLCNRVQNENYRQKVKKKNGGAEHHTIVKVVCNTVSNKYKFDEYFYRINVVT